MLLPVAVGAATDLAIRRPTPSVATAVLFVMLSAVLLASGRLATRHSRYLVAAAPAFAIWAMLRASPWLVPLDLIAAFGLIVVGVSTSSNRGLVSLRSRELVAQPVTL